MINDEAFGLHPLDQPPRKVRIVLDQQNAYVDLPRGLATCAESVEHGQNFTTMQPGRVSYSFNRTDKTLKETAMKLKTIIPTGLIAALPTVAAQAHHAFARFDSEREVTLHGTVNEFQWTSPHAWLMLTVQDKGCPERWAIEMNGASGLARQGWKPDTLTPGMPVKAVIRPLRDGTNGGQFLEIVLPDGTKLAQPASVRGERQSSGMAQFA
jgi:hypothetical protein